MDRRGFIVTTGAVLVAGCLSGSATEQTPTPETPSEAADPTPTASQNTDPGQSPPAATTSTSTSHKTPPSRELTEVTVSEIETSDFSVQTRIERAAITPDQTARFALTITSHLQETEFGFSNCIPFTCVTESDPGGLLLLPYNGWYGRSNRTPIERQTQSTWVPAPDQTLAAPDVVKGRTLNDGESLTRRWELWGDPNDVSYIEPGTYDVRAVTGIDTNHEWHCTITVEQT